MSNQNLSEFLTRLGLQSLEPSLTEQKVTLQQLLDVSQTTNSLKTSFGLKLGDAKKIISEAARINSVSISTSDSSKHADSPKNRPTRVSTRSTAAAAAAAAAPLPDPVAQSKAGPPEQAAPLVLMQINSLVHDKSNASLQAAGTVAEEAAPTKVVSDSSQSTSDTTVPMAVSYTPAVTPAVPVDASASPSLSIQVEVIPPHAASSSTTTNPRQDNSDYTPSPSHSSSARLGAVASTSAKPVNESARNVALMLHDDANDETKRRRFRKDPLMMLNAVKVRTLLGECANRMLDAASGYGVGDRLSAELVAGCMSAFDPSETALDRIRDHLLEALALSLSVIAEHVSPTADVNSAIVHRYVTALVSRLSPSLPVLTIHEFLPLVYELVAFDHAESVDTNHPNAEPRSGPNAAATSGLSTSVMPADFSVLLTPNERVAIIFAAFGHLVSLYVGVTPTAADVRTVDHLRAFLQDKQAIRAPLYDLQKLIQVAYLLRLVPGVGADVGVIARRRLVMIYYNSFETGRKRAVKEDATADAPASSPATAAIVARFDAVFDGLDVEGIAAFTGEPERVINVKSRAYLALVRLCKDVMQHGPNARTHLKETLMRDLREWRGGAVGEHLDADLRRFEVVNGYALLSPAFALAAVLELPRRLLESKGNHFYFSFAKGEGEQAEDEEEGSSLSSTTGLIPAKAKRASRRKTAGAANTKATDPEAANRKRRRTDFGTVGAAVATEQASASTTVTDDMSETQRLAAASRRDNVVSVQTMNDYLSALCGGKRVSRDAVTTVNRMVENEMTLILFGFVRARAAGIPIPMTKLNPDDIDRCYRC